MAILRVLLLLTLLGVTSPSKVVLKDNGYEGVVISLEDNLPLNKCQQILRGIEELLRSSSHVIFDTSRGRASFRKATVIVPRLWTSAECPLLHARLQGTPQTPPLATTADIRVTMKSHPKFGAKPWTAQSKGCSQKGEYVSLGHEELLKNETRLNGRLLAHAWLKYRYGVFDETGDSGSTMFPTAHRGPDGSWVASACANAPLTQRPLCGAAENGCNAQMPDLRGNTHIKTSFMAFPHLDSVSALCDEGSHDPTSPTPHNLICNAKSVWEVMRASPDFQNNRNVEGLSRPGEIQFTYTRPKEPRMVLLVEDTSIMNFQKRWDFMRKAIRKLVIFDVPSGFEVGLVVFDSAATAKFPLKALDNPTARDSLGSSLPRNPSRVDKHNRCVLCGLEESVKMLRNSGGTEGGHVVLLMAGSGHVDEKELKKIEQLLDNSNIILHVIVYPLTEKFPKPGGKIEALGAHTGGLTFNIPDEGIGDDSKIVMYYDLLDSLFHTLNQAAGGNALPVKVHSAEHKGGLSQKSEGSFWVDPGLGSDTVFAVFYYDLAHVGDEIHLINPNGQVIDTGNMQSEDDNMNMITIRLRKNQEARGLWKYNLDNRADSHQALFVQVTSRPQNSLDSDSINVRSWTNQNENRVNLTDVENPLIVFAEIRIGLAPVKNAKVTATLTKLGVRPNGTEHKPIQVELHDNGLLSPDIFENDGIYSRYIPHLSVGKFSAVVDVVGRIGKHKFSRHLRMGILDIVGARPVSDTIPPSRITNFRATLLPGTSGQVTFAWTAPGDDFDFGQAKSYKVLVNDNLQSLRDRSGKSLRGWPTPLSAYSIQQHTTMWKDYKKVFYVGMYAEDSIGNVGDLSNVIEIYVPTPTTSRPLTVVTLPSSAQNVEINLASDRVFGGFNTKQLVVVFGCIAGFLLIISLVICYCTSLHRKNKNRSEKIKEPKDTFNVTVTVGNKASDYSHEKSVTDGLKKDYLRPINSWSPSELLGNQPDKRGSLSGRSDLNSDHSGSTKKSCGGSSDPPQYYSNGQYYEGNSYNEAYPIPSDGYPTPVEGYSQALAYQGTKDAYAAEGFSPYVATQAADSFMSESCDVIPGTQGPPGYSVFPYDNSLRNSKVPPPIPPKPKVHYTPEPYIYEGTDLSGRNSSNTSVSSEKRIRNVTMV